MCLLREFDLHEPKRGTNITPFDGTLSGNQDVLARLETKTTSTSEFKTLGGKNQECTIGTPKNMGTVIALAHKIKGETRDNQTSSGG